jgi:hypothetical protein
VTGRHGSMPPLALLSLLLTLLVPAQATALCCLGVAGPAAAAGAHAAHGPTPHHPAGGGPAPVGPGLGSAADSGCVVVTASPPALRERARSGETPTGAGNPAPPVARVPHPGPPPRLASLPRAPVSLQVDGEAPRPLRL